MTTITTITMDDRIYRAILKRLHPDSTTDPAEKTLLHEIFQAFRALPIATVSAEQRRERERSETTLREMAARREWVRKRNSERAKKGVETRRRNAAAAAQGDK